MKAYKETVRKYYKWTDWTQPVLSANGVIGGNSFAVASNKETQRQSDPYKTYEAFDNDPDTYWRSGTSSGWVEFYNPVPLMVTNIYWQTYYNYPTAGSVEASDDGVNWIQLTTFTHSSLESFNISLSSNDTGYKYYRINIDSVNTDVIHCGEIDITAKYPAESTSSDYDFYEDVDFYKIYKSGTTYKAFNV